MKKLYSILFGLWIASLSGSVFGWAHADRYGGGATFHAPGSDSTTRTNAYGGSATHTYGEGTTATGAYGGTAYHQEGSGQTEMQGAYGGTATHYAGYGTVGTSAYGNTAYHSPYYGGAIYPAYHPPTTVNYYGSGCYNCGGWSTAGAAATGLVVGAAIATAATTSANAANTTNAYNAGVAAGSSNAYSAGYVAGANNAMAYTMGGIYPTLPAGCMTPSVGGVSYYLCGNNWFLPSYGANGVYYRVVAAP